MKKVFFSMVIALGLISIVVIPAAPNESNLITANHGLEH